MHMLPKAKSVRIGNAFVILNSHGLTIVDVLKRNSQVSPSGAVIGGNEGRYSLLPLKSDQVLWHSNAKLATETY